MGDLPPVIGVCGAGTMGAGIAQLAAAAGARVLVHDPAPRAAARVAGPHVEVADGLDALAPAGLVIEAVPEQLELKRELLAALEDVVAPDAVLATNTSSLSVTEIAAGARRPERVAGMHFFNPAPVMRLVEVVAGERTDARSLALVRTVARAMGKQVIDAADTPGFLVNRCNRPFNLEALRLVEQGLSTPEQVDRIVRLGGGYRMGPFELMDLVGLDTALAVQLSFWEQSFGEPRWRPSGLLRRRVASGRLGRKTGEGWHVHPHERADPQPPQPGGGEGLVVIAGDTMLAFELFEAALEVGWDVATPEESEGELPTLIVDCGAGEEDPPLQGGPQVVLCDAAPLAAIDPGGTSAGFFVLPPLEDVRLVELTRTATTSDTAARAAAHFFTTLGHHVEWVADAPGLVLGRIACQLINEACFALGEGVGSAEDVDVGLVLGLNHPHGPLEWADHIGPANVLAVVQGLHAEYAEERYRPAPALVQAVRDETLLQGARLDAD